MTARLLDVIGDGNCFLRAVFHSARALGLLSNVGRCLAIGDSGNCSSFIESEDGFIICARHALAEYVSALPQDYVDTFEYLRSLDPKTRGLVMLSQTSWLQDVYHSSTSGWQFAQACAEKITMSGQWLGQREVKAFKHMLSKCASIDILIHSVRTKDAARVTADQYRASPFPRDTLVLVNVDEIHYN